MTSSKIVIERAIKSGLIKEKRVFESEVLIWVDCPHNDTEEIALEALLSEVRCAYQSKDAWHKQRAEEILSILKLSMAEVEILVEELDERMYG